MSKVYALFALIEVFDNRCNLFSVIFCVDVDNVVLVKGRDGGAALADMRARDLEQQEIQRERVREREKRCFFFLFFLFFFFFFFFLP